MPEPFTQDGDFSIAEQEGPTRFSNAFDGVNDKTFCEDDWKQFSEDYTPLALDTEHPVYSGYYLIEETPHSDVGCGVVKWTRRYAKIPDSRTEYEQFSWIRPGLTGGGIYVQYEAINADVVVTGDEVEIPFTEAHDLQIGDFVLVFYTAFVVRSGIPDPTVSFSIQIYREVLDINATEASSVTVQIPSHQDPIYLAVRKASTGREPETLNVDSRLVFDYYLPGVSVGITTPEDIETIAAYEIIDGNGQTTNTFDLDSTPGQIDYLDDVDNEVYIVAEQSVKRRVFGNIWERTTRYVKAQ